jgi:hypothetical protein
MTRYHPLVEIILTYRNALNNIELAMGVVRSYSPAKEQEPGSKL